MAVLSRVHMNLVNTLLRERKDSVALSDRWRTLHSAFDVGEIRGDRLHFNSEERQKLRELAHRAWGFDPLHGVPDGSRIDVAAQAVSDKLATQTPDDAYVLAKRIHGPLAGIAHVPPEIALRLSIEAIDLGAVTALVIIENLDCFDHWATFNLPAELHSALAVYRGHDCIARAVRRLVENLPANCPVIVFADADPAGVAIALATPRVTHLLVPKLDSALRAKSHRADFDAQHRAMSTLDQAELGGWRPWWQTLKDGRYSIKQQHMLALKTPLSLLTKQEHLFS